MAKVTKEDWKSSPDSDEETKREQGEQSIPEFEHESLAVKLLFDKLNESIDLSNNQVDTIALNTAKTGITTAQASAITDNTAKTGITTAQAGQIVLQGKTLQEFTGGSIPVSSGSLIFTMDAKTGNLTFTWRSGKTIKRGTLKLS